jgi:hypothetical protein
LHEEHRLRVGHERELEKGQKVRGAPMKFLPLCWAPPPPPPL